MTMIPLLLTIVLAQAATRPLTVPSMVPPTQPAYQMTADDVAEAKKGVALHDQQKYDDAIAVYEGLIKAHPDNAGVLHEWALTAFAKKDYPSALTRASQCAQYRSAALEGCYALMGAILDSAGQPQKAIEVYTSAVHTLPSSGTLYYNLATTYLGLKDVEHARQTLKQGAMAAPAHAGMHLLLGQLFLQEQLRAPAFLALSHFLLIEPSSARTADAYRAWLSALNGVGTPNERGGLDAGVNIRDTSEGSQVQLDVLLVASQSLEAELTQGEMAGQPRIAIMAERLRVLYGVIGSLPTPADNPPFTFTYYVPFFREMASKGFVEPYVYYISQRTNLPGVREWLSSHPDQLQALAQWVKGYRWPTPAAEPTGTGAPAR